MCLLANVPSGGRTLRARRALSTFGDVLNPGPNAHVLPSSLEAQHRELNRFNQRRFTPVLPKSGWEEDLAEEVRHRVLEAELIEAERAELRPQLAGVPTQPKAFIEWFKGLEHDGPGQGDRLFPFLAKDATLEQMRWFLYQEVAGEAGFEDLVALTQVKLPTRPKLELGRNFWDELGRGQQKGMHGPMLENLANELAVHPKAENVVWESLALGNVMIALAANRRYTYQSIGALGAIELTAPTRAIHVVEGLKRLGVSPRGRQYFALHAVLDVKHAQAWIAEVLEPLVSEQPEVAPALAEGALLRLRAGARCFERYRRELGWMGTTTPVRVERARMAAPGLDVRIQDIPSGSAVTPSPFAH